MASAAATLQAQAQALTQADLLVLWDLVQTKQPTPGWALGKALEYLFLRAFELEGVDVSWPYNVTVPQKLGVVEQIDGVVHLDGIAFLIECKDAKAIDVEPLAKLRFRLEQRPPICMGVLVSTADFTTAAGLFAQFSSPLNVLLWGSDDLDYALRNKKMRAGLEAKLRWASLRGLPEMTLRGAV